MEGEEKQKKTNPGGFNPKKRWSKKWIQTSIHRGKYHVCKKNIIHLIGWIKLLFCYLSQRRGLNIFSNKWLIFLFRDVQPLHQICPTFPPNVWFQTCLTFLNCDYSVSFVHTSWTPVGLVMERWHSTGKTIRLKCFEVIGGRSFSFVFTHHSPVMFRLKKGSKIFREPLTKIIPRKLPCPSAPNTLWKGV